MKKRISDRERLDFLIRKRYRLDTHGGHYASPRWRVWDVLGGFVSQRDGARAAIDAAIRAERKRSRGQR